jgi:hypothetical protein
MPLPSEQSSAFQSCVLWNYRCGLSWDVDSCIIFEMDCLIASSSGRIPSCQYRQHIASSWLPEPTSVFHGKMPVTLIFVRNEKVASRLGGYVPTGFSLESCCVYSFIQRFITQTETLRKPCFFHYVDCMRSLTATQDGQENFTQSSRTTVNNTMSHWNRATFVMSGGDMNAYLLRVLIDIQKFPGNFVINFFICARPWRVTDCCRIKLLWTWTVKGNVIIPVQTKTTTLSIVERAYIKELGQRVFYILMD